MTEYDNLVAQARAQIQMVAAQRDTALAHCIELAGQIGILQARLNAVPVPQPETDPAMYAADQSAAALQAIPK